MTTTDRPSRWADVTADAYAWTVDALASGDLDPADPDQWVHETADGSAHVIWNDNTWSLWRDPSAPDWEAEISPSADPQALLTAYAYDVTTQALRAALDALTGPDAPAWGPCTRCGEPVYVEAGDPARGRLSGPVVTVRSGDEGGTYDLCTAADDYRHRMGTRTRTA